MQTTTAPVRRPLAFAFSLLCLALFTTSDAQERTTGEALYQKHCATCHGKDLTGGNAQSMVDGIWQFGGGQGDMFRNIKFGISSRGMPDYKNALSDKQIRDIIAWMNEAQNRLGVERPPLPEKLATRHYDVGVSKWVADGLKVPWSLVFTGDNTAIVSERPGRLRMVVDGKLAGEPIAGTPDCLAEGQGGYMDVVLDPNYTDNGWVYLSYTDSYKNDAGNVVAMTQVARGRVRDNQWTDTQVVFSAPKDSYSTTRHHFGSRLAFDHQGRLLITVGDRGAMELAQDPMRPNGKVHRVMADGSIPQDNPFADGKKGLKTVFSYGHRNSQGIAVHPETGEIWETEHGPMGGDEVNVVVAGGNYGWPKVTYGIDYDGTPVSDKLALSGTKQPALYWVPSIAVCGTRFCQGDEFPRWKNNLLVGGLSHEELRRLVIADGRVIHQEVILKSAGRVRDMACDPSGAVYVVLNRPDIIVKLTNGGKALRQ